MMQDSGTYQKPVGIVRQLKLHALMGAKVTIDPRIPAIIKFFEDLFNGLHISSLSSYSPDDIFFHKKGLLYMKFDSDDNKMWCRYDDYWSVFADMCLEDDEIQQIITIMIKKYLHKNLVDIYILGNLSIRKTEMLLKKQNTIPNIANDDWFERMERVLW